MVPSRAEIFNSAGRKALCLSFLATFALLAGCAGITTTTVADGALETPAATSGIPFTGKLFGGQQPVIGAVVTLWRIGITGYGSAPTRLAYTTTDTNGAFAFQVAGTTSAYTCSGTSASNFTYLTSTGGTSQGVGGTVNSAISMMTILGGPTQAQPGVSTDICGTEYAAAPFVQMNEVTTAVAVYALAQFFNPTPVSYTNTNTSVNYSVESIGTSSTNISGINNAFNNTGSILNLGTGLVNASYQPFSQPNGSTTFSNTYGHALSTVTPEAQKIYLIANILAACINSSVSTSTQCTRLFADAVPPPTPGTTALGSGFTFPTATDTLQAAYYLAVNPINASTAGTPGQTAGGTSRLVDLYNLAAPTAPFASTAAQPTDWTIGMTIGSTTAYTGSGGSNYIISAPTSVAIDEQGNVFFISNTTATVNNLSALSPFGAVELAKYDGNVLGAGLSMDSSVSTTTPKDIVYFSHQPTTSPTTAVPTGYAGGNTTASSNSFLFGSGFADFKDSTTAVSSVNGYSFTADSANVYFPVAASGYVYEVPNDTTSSATYATSPPTTTLVAMNNGNAITGLTSAGTIAADAASTPHVWVSAPAGNGVYSIPTSTYPVTTGAAPTAYTGFQTPTGIAIDHSNNVWVTNGASSDAAATGVAASGFISEIVAGATSATNDTTPTHGGIANPMGVAIDGAGNVWVASQGTGAAFTGQTVSELALIGTTTPTLTSLSPSVGFAHTFGGPGSIAIDQSGNVWVANVGTTANSTTPGFVTVILGAAVPTVAKLPLAVKNNTLGTKP